MVQLIIVQNKMQNDSDFMKKFKEWKITKRRGQTRNENNHTRLFLHKERTGEDYLERKI